MSDDGGNSTVTTFQVPTMPQEPPATQAPPATPNFIDMVPEAYRNKPYMADIAKSEKPFENLLNQFENAQALIGKKSTGIEIPGQDATPEAVKAFHKALGVPESVEGYEYKPVDLSKESEPVQKYATELMKDDSFLKAMKAKALEIGLTPKQFQEFGLAYDAFTLEQAKAAVGAAEQQGEKTKALFNTIYGDQASEVERIAKETAAKVLPQNVKDSGDVNLALFEAMRFIHEKLYKNDQIGGGNNAGAPATTKADIQKKINELRDKPEANDPFMRGYDEINAEIKALYKRLHEEGT